MEKENIIKVLKEEGSIRKAALKFGISYTALRYWIKKYDIANVNPVSTKGRTCRHCSETDPTKFYASSVNGLCKSCFSSYIVERTIALKKEMIQRLGGCCMECGYDRYYGALEFHHRDPSEKEHHWSKMRFWNRKKMIAEVDKCDLLCATCHREVHGGIRRR